MDKLDKRRIFNVIKSLFTGFDVPLALIVFLLLGTGLVALYSAAIDMPGRVEDQVRNILLSFVLMWIISSMKSKRIGLPLSGSLFGRKLQKRRKKTQNRMA